jgi:hypothetical protein
MSEAWMFDLTAGVLETGALPTAEFVIENIGFDEEPSLPDRIADQPIPARGLDPSRRDGRKPLPHAIKLEGAFDPRAFEITAGPAGSLFTTERVAIDKSWSLSPSNRHSFTVWNRDVAPVPVRESEFRPEGEGLVARVVPSRGWGVLLVFRADDPRTTPLPERTKLERSRSMRDRKSAKELLEALSMPPLPGVRIHLNGAPLAVSDADGCALVTYVVPPDRLSLSAPGWRLSALERIPGPGSRWWVWMRREP